MTAIVMALKAILVLLRLSLLVTFLKIIKLFPLTSLYNVKQGNDRRYRRKLKMKLENRY